jgi:hypothetical protein
MDPREMRLGDCIPEVSVHRRAAQSQLRTMSPSPCYFKSALTSFSYSRCDDCGWKHSFPVQPELIWGKEKGKRRVSICGSGGLFVMEQNWEADKDAKF